MYCRPRFPRGAAFVPCPVRACARSCRSESGETTSMRASSMSVSQEPSRGLGLFVNVGGAEDRCGNASVVLGTTRTVTRGCPRGMRLHVTRGIPFTRCMGVVGNDSTVLSRLCDCAPSVGPLRTVTENVVYVNNKRPRGCRVVRRRRLHPVVGIRPGCRDMCRRLRRLILRPRLVPRLGRRDLRCVDGRRRCVGMTGRCRRCCGDLLT